MRLVDADELIAYVNTKIDEMTGIGVSIDAEYLWELLNHAVKTAPTIDRYNFCPRCGAPMD